MIAPTGRLKGKNKSFHEIVFDMRHVVFDIVRERKMPGGKGAMALGTGFFVSPKVFITCDHVMNDPKNPHIDGDSYYLVANLTGKSGKVYTVASPTIGKEINLFPNLDLAVLLVSAAPDQPYCALEYGDVWEGEDIGVVGYPLAELRAMNGNVYFDAVLYRAARGCVTARYTTNDGALLAVPCIEVNFLFVPGNSGGPVFSATTGRVLGFVRGYKAIKIRESIATATMIPQLPLGIGNQYIENLNAIYSVAVKLDYIRSTIEGFGVTL
jgi:S1-C subfamily serine protease